MNRKYFSLPLIAAALLSLTILGGCKKHDDQSANQQTTITATQSSTSDASTAGSDFNSKPSDAPRINVQLVEQALSQVQQTDGNDPNSWIPDFRNKVNQIWDGDDVISIDTPPPDASNNLVIIGYISHSGKEGYQADTDDEIFRIQQTAAVANASDPTPYRMTYSTYGGSAAYYDGYYTNPYLGGWWLNVVTYHTWGGYYTSPAHIVVIHSYRDTYRATPAYVQQRAATHAYYTQTYHGAPVTVRPGASIGSGVTVKPGASVAPAHVTAPPAFVAPPKGAGSGAFNRPTAGAPSAIAPPRAAAPTTTFARPNAAPPALENRPGGLFNRNTFSNTAPKSFAPSSSRSSGGSRHK